MNTMPTTAELTEHQKARINFVADYVQDSTQDWLQVKRQIINAFDPPSRSLFSTRHPKTKKHFINEFDKLVMSYWESVTGMNLEVDPDKLHDTLGWVHKPKGWALFKMNHERSSQHSPTITSTNS